MVLIAFEGAMRKGAHADQSMNDNNKILIELQLKLKM